MIWFARAKVLYVGISDAPAWWIAQANTLAHLRGWSPFIGLQIEYSLIERTVERELVPMAKALNLGLTAWSPLSGGVLSGKYHGHGSSEQGRMNSEMMKEYMPEQQRADRVVAAVKDRFGSGRSQHGAGSRWHGFATVLCRSSPSSVRESFLSCRTISPSFDLTLSANHLKTLEEASRIELGFPHHFYAMEMVRTILYGGMRDQILA